ncbi:MAG: PD40 domain-containing protein, partial [Candidatus Eisenbacteria sp.]|nr:PD40 domain-containing protein [Candidatus Eisenbacteria bacterium]
MRTYASRTATLAVILGSIIGLFALAVGTPSAEAKPGYFRHPDIHGNRVVFTAEGDLWIAILDGLQVRDVRRISSHPGDEMAARFSPDGKWIAFTGYYDGNSDIYIVSAGGGEPRRLTWHPASDRAIGWTPDGKRLIFSSMRCNPHWNSELFALPVEGGEPEKLPLGRANYIDMDVESGLWAFTRTWGGGTWKRYRGGTAPNIWVGHPARGDFTEVTDFDGPEVLPMWHGGRIYFLCDQGGTANIWSILPDGSGRTQHTHFKVWDARWAAMGPSGRIVFTLAGDLHIFDPSDGSEATLSIDLPSERNLTRKRYPNPSQYLTGYTLAPEGDRVAVAVRGEIFSIPVEDGVTLPVTRGSGARESRVSYGPKGKRVVYVTDESGEEAIVTADAWGRGDVKEVKGSGKAGWHFPPVCSPDGEWIAYADMTHRLYVVKADGGKPHEVDRCAETEIRDYAWSPDGRWLAYAMNNSVEFSSIYIYDTKKKTSHQLTGWETDDFNPTWDPQGRYLYFLSARSINPMIGWFDFETIVVNPTKLYMVLLRSDVENPLAHTKGMPPKDDEDADKKDKKDGDTDKDDKSDEEDKAIEPVEIEFEGLADRIVQLPVDAGKYRGVAATEGKLFYLSLPLTGLNEEEGPEDRPAPKGTLMVFDLEEKEASTFMDGVAGFDLQAKAGKILISKGQGQLIVVDAGSPPGEDLSDAAVSLDGIVVELDPHEEWRQIYFEGWRNMRDFYWDEGMHGVDWKAVRDQYATLLPRLATRQDLTDLMEEMVGELVTSHTYVWGGDPGRVVPRHSTGLLGAVMVREKDAFRVERIYRGGVADGVRSPLQEPGVNVKEGEYILEINLQPFPPDKPFEA